VRAPLKSAARQQVRGRAVGRRSVLFCTGKISLTHFDFHSNQMPWLAICKRPRRAIHPKYFGTENSINKKSPALQLSFSRGNPRNRWI